MKCIGIVGGMSWESTAHYYAALNEGVKKRLGGFHSAQVALWSVDFAEIEALQRDGDWEQAGEVLADAAKRLERAGAQCILIGANTMHKVADAVSRAVSIPLLHIGDATADAVIAAGDRKVLLLGTRYTMEQSFLRNYLTGRGLNVIVPDADDQATVHSVIFNELVLGVVRDESRRRLQQVMERGKATGCEGVILGCTELGMILRPEHSDLRLYDTTALHAKYALDFSLRD